MFDDILKATKKRTLQRAEKELQNNPTMVEICAEESGEYTLLIDGHLDTWIASDDWECSCNSTVDPCHHVLIGVLAVQQGLAKVQSKPVVKGNLRYKLKETTAGIGVKRVWVSEDEEY